MRRKIVKNFIIRQYRHVDIIALQEVKVKNKTKLKNNLRNLLPGARIIIDYMNSERGGSALLINQKLMVSETGVSGFEGAAWATVHAASGSIRVASLHAPNTKEERQTYWEWWDSQIDREDWVLVGDFNNVELPEDSKGKSALMQGSEERAWRRMVNRMDSIDAYMATVRTKGGLFTRLAFCRQRYDQARKILKEEKNKQKNDCKEGDDIRREEEDMRIILQEEDNEETMMRLLSKENELRKWELRDAKAWRLRSKERWFREGEAPSRYFYSQLKAKFAREKIAALETEDGNFISSHTEIMEEVERYYRNLYTRVQEIAQIRQAREHMLQLLTSRVTQEEDATLHQVPTEEGLEEVIHDYHKEKSPGLDGLVAEVLQACWSFVKTDCIDMFIDFWERGALTEKNRTAVVKLLPKNS
ncbi:hypothetical protein R1sor_003380 [Riccia sorocarpa]|uniref:Endonuclease/exonuclease/phosphatase domain-containing protein n=1 Tax=Riccia sorocarpa TaxID=122646 RepID=A0ABD3H292_9MARC